MSNIKFSYFSFLLKMLYHIYCDESSTTTGRFMVIGGIIFPANSDASITQGIIDKKKSLGLVHEVSWDSISKSVADRYFELFMYIFNLIDTGKICFKLIIVDKTKYDNKRFKNNIKENSFYKMYFQLLYHKFCRQWYQKSEKSRFNIFPDEKSSNISLLNLKTYLNNSIRFHLMIDEMVLEIIPQVSKQSPVIQAIDLFIGCVSYYSNGYYKLEGASKSKKDFIFKVQNYFQMEDFTVNTSIKSRRYEIWNIKFKEKK